MAKLKILLCLGLLGCASPKVFTKYHAICANGKVWYTYANEDFWRLTLDKYHNAVECIKDE